MVLPTQTGPNEDKEGGERKGRGIGSRLVRKLEGSGGGVNMIKAWNSQRINKSIFKNEKKDHDPNISHGPSEFSSSQNIHFQKDQQ